jgi:hypothetical protein
MGAIRLAVICATLALIATACGGEPANQLPRAEGTAAGFTTYAVPSAGFRVAVPECWRVLTATDVFGDDGAGFDELARGEPDFARYREVLTAPNSPVKLIGLDCDTPTNLNVIATDVPNDLSFEDFVARSATDFADVDRKAASFTREVVKLPVGTALRLSYTSRKDGDEQAKSTLQYGLVAKGKAYFLTYTTGASRAAEYEHDFERSAHSFHFL